MPLTEFQKTLAQLLSKNRSDESYLAGGAALHFSPQSLRYSRDLDYFNDSDVRVSEAFAADEKLLEESGYGVSVELNQPGYIRSVVSLNNEATKVEWCHETSWRFLPVEKDPQCGFILNPIDLAINKVLTVAGRNEPRDFVDTLYVHEKILPLPALCWAAVSKDPGFNPESLLELLRRRGRFQQSDFDKLELVEAPDLQKLKTSWLQALEETEEFFKIVPPDFLGCLFYSKKKKTFVLPTKTDFESQNVEPHYGQPGGVLPSVKS